MRDWATAKARNIGQHISIPSSKPKSRSPSPAPSSSSGRKPQASASITPYPQALPTTNTPPIAGSRAPDHTLASSTAANPAGAGPAASPVSSTTTKQPAATPPTLAQAPPTPTALPQTLSPLEIRQRTADLLKIRLSPEELEKIKWDETTEEQAKAVVEEVQWSLEGKPEHTGKMYKTLQYINQYSKIIDVAIQHQPCITALIWAGVRTVIQVSGHSLFVNLYPSGAPRPPNVASSVNAQVDVLHMELGFVYLAISCIYLGLTTCQVAWNRYETYDSLEQAVQAITAMIANCAFYHGLYRSFAESPKSTTLGYNKETFGALEAQLPELYAAVIELSVKAKNHWKPPSVAGEYYPLPKLLAHFSNTVK